MSDDPRFYKVIEVNPDRANFSYDTTATAALFPLAIDKLQRLIVSDIFRDYFLLQTPYFEEVYLVIMPLYGPL